LKILLAAIIVVVSGCAVNKPEPFVKKVKRYRVEFNFHSSYCPVASHPYLYEKKMEAKGVD
jgi:hypothetical protein